MKRIIKKIIVVFLCCVVTIICTTNRTVEIIALEDVISVEDIDVDFYNKQAESIKQYKNMLYSFNVQSETRSSEQMYDDNYGGSYIDDDGELVVLLVHQDDDSIEKMRMYSGNDSLKTLECDYSFNELLTVINAINNSLGYLRENGIIISEMYENVYTNRVHIGVDTLTEDKERMIRSIVNSECMYIYNKDEKLIQTLGDDVKGGDEVLGNEDSTVSTIGFCATRYGVEGFVISGHVGDIVGESYRTSSGALLGSVTETAFMDYFNSDASFVAKSSLVNTTDKIHIYKCRYLGSDIAFYPIGATICKYGISTEHTIGEIKYNHFTGSVDGVYLLNQCTADFEVDYGDSGGPVYMVEGVINGEITCRLMGIISAKNGDYGDPAYYSVFSKYMCIANDLELEAITSE